MMRPLPRRTMLRAAGALIGLPLLEAMLPNRASAFGGFPDRFVTSFGGVATGSRLGTPPAPIGRLGTLTTPYTPIQDLVDHVSLVSGLTIRRHNVDADVGPGEMANENHGKQLSPMFSGVRSLRDQYYVFGGPTADQIVATALGAGTLYPGGYNLLIQPHGYQYGANGRNVISARGRGGGDAGVREPSVAFDALFRGVAPSPGTPSPGASADLLRDASVLDLVSEGASRLAARLGHADRVRIEQHLEQIRALELTIANLIAGAGTGTMTPGSTCSAPPAPPALGAPALFDAPDGQRVGWSNEDTRADIMAELAALAFACDLTRSMTWQISWEQCGISARFVIANDKAFHQIGHDGPSADVVGVYRWHIEQFGKLLRALQRLPEGGGTVLDSTFAAFLPGEFPGSHGSADGTAVVGGHRALRLGESIRTVDAHPARVLIAGMQAVGVATDELGEVSGALTELLA